MKQLPVFFRQSSSTILSDERGVALMEFGMILPILLILALGIIEANRALLTVQKLEKTIILTNNIVTQHASVNDISNSNVPISAAEMAKIMGEVPFMMDPYKFTSNGRVIITDVTTGASAAAPVIRWQYCGGGTMNVNSKIGKGVTGSAPAATLPTGFAMKANEEVVIGEIFFQYTPLLKGFLPKMQLYRNAVFVPRFETLVGLASNCP